METTELVDFCEHLKQFDLLLTAMLRENAENRRKLTDLKTLTVRLLDMMLGEISERRDNEQDTSAMLPSDHG